MPKVLGNSLNVKSVVNHKAGVAMTERMNAECWQVVIDKDFLQLLVGEAPTVLRNEGYTIQCSNRPDDRILFDCFYYSFSRNYASALLKKDGWDGLEIGK